MNTYRCTFERIGRTHGVPPMTVQLEDRDDLPDRVYAYARPYLGSRDVDVVIDFDKDAGMILAGFHNAGDFAVDCLDSRDAHTQNAGVA